MLCDRDCVPTTSRAKSKRSGMAHSAILAILCCLALGADAYSAEAAPSVEAQLAIDRMIKALGGREAIGRLRSLAAEANCDGPDGAFRTRVESFRPDAVYFHRPGRSSNMSEPESDVTYTG